jgi:hypothetical protein
MRTNAEGQDTMTEQEMERVLLELFEEVSWIEEDDDEMTVAAPRELVGLEEAGTFASHGLLSGNRGLVLRLADGSEFQITIVQSR